MIIERPHETRRIRDSRKWVLVYGRRKTGKTFIIRNFIEHDEYFFVKRNRTILSGKEDTALVYEAFIEILKRSLRENKTVVVDEFHRLGDDFFDLLHFMEKGGKLILVSSTLFLSKRLISSKSALLGIFTEIPIGLINLGDCITALKNKGIGKKDLIELAIMAREPIAIDYLDLEKDPRETLAEIIMGSIRTIPALIGEIFLEEEREMSAIYEGVLRAVASGKVVSGEISSYLFSRKLIKKDDPSIISQYLNNLVSFGLIKKIKVFNKNRFVYKHISHLAKIFYYADEKYNISERSLSSGEMSVIINEMMPRLVEDNIRGGMAEKMGLIENLAESKDFEIDGYLLKFKKPEVALEVKWKRLKKDDIRRAEENLARVDSKEKILFVPDKTGIKTNLNVMDVGDI